MKEKVKTFILVTVVLICGIAIHIGFNVLIYIKGW